MPWWTFSKGGFDRARLITALYDETGGAELNIVDFGDLGQQLGMSADDVTNAAHFLEGSGLSSPFGSWAVLLHMRA